MRRPYQPHLISAILSEPWAITEQFVNDQYIPIANILKGDVLFEEGSPVLPEIVAASGESTSSSNKGDAKNVSVITIAGPLTKNSQFCGPAGMKAIGSWIREADNDSNVSGILLLIDSPGGTVNGTEELANIIRDTQKPIVAFVEDLSASAAYWLASQCDEIIANNSTAQVGSIGVMTSFIDVQPALELLGYKFHTITAPQSTDKVKTYEQLRAGNYADYKENHLKPIAEKFISTVKASRGDLDDKYFTGEVFFAKDVLGTLIDSIDTYDNAIQRVIELTTTEKFTSSNTNTKMSKPEYKRLAKASGVEALESADGSITLQEEQAKAVESALEAHETTIASLQAKESNSSNQQARVTELEGQLKTANDKIAELEKGAGAESATITKETDGEEGTSDSFYARFNKLKNQ